MCQTEMFLKSLTKHDDTGLTPPNMLPVKPKTFLSQSPKNILSAATATGGMRQGTK